MKRHTSDPPTTFIVVNPEAAGGAVGRNWEQLRALIQANYGPFRHHFTRSRGHARDLAQEARGESYDLVVALGGDGTISEVVDGLLRSNGTPETHTALGVLPFGTGSDLSRSLSLPKNLAMAARNLRDKDKTTIDVGRVSLQTKQGGTIQRHFVNVASFGMTGLVDRLLASSSKAWGGKVTYAWATLRAWRDYQPVRIRLRLDDATAGKTSERDTFVQLVAIANGRYFGGGMKIAPHAVLDDGQFDLVIVKPLPLSKLLRNAAKVYSGRHDTLPEVELMRVSRMEALPVTADDILLDLDGEIAGMLPATFEIVPRALAIKY